MQLAYKSSSDWKRVDFNVNNVLLGEKKSNNDNQLYYIQNIFVCLKKNKIPIYTSFKYKIKNMYMLIKKNPAYSIRKHVGYPGQIHNVSALGKYF